MINKASLTGLAAAACLLYSFSQPALALDVAGARLDDTIRLDNHDLMLNGAGVRTKLVFKVYALGIYLEQKQASVPAVLAASGPRRISIVMLRDVSSDDFGDAFITGLTHNSNKDEQSKMITPTRQFGEMFALIPGLKKGDALTVDWLPGTGIVCTLNGKKIGTTVNDAAFYNAILKIWLGDEPADKSLKPRLLGQAG